MLSLNLTIEIFLSVTKLYFIYFLINYFGFFYGFLLYLVFNNLKNVVLNKILNLELVAPADKCFININMFKPPTILAIIYFEDFDAENIRNLIIEKAIKKIQKLRSRIIYKLFNYYWQEIPLKLVLERIKILENFKNKDSILEYAEKSINIKSVI